MNGHELLAFLAPPIGLVDWLERSFAAKAASGQHVPADYVEWLQRWQDIRSIEPSPIDGATPAAWSEVGDVVTQATRELAY